MNGLVFIIRNSEKGPLQFLTAHSDIFRLLVLVNQCSKTQKYSTSNDGTDVSDETDKSIKGLHLRS